MKIDFAPLLLGKDLRSISRSDEVARTVEDQESFDQLFNLLLRSERLLVMRAADAIEKITLSHPGFLQPHKKQLLSLLKSSVHKEFKWHLGLLTTRVDLDKEELREVWGVLGYWAQNPNESRIVRVNSIQGLFELVQKDPTLREAFENVLKAIENESVPSLRARIKKLKKAMHL